MGLHRHDTICQIVWCDVLFYCLLFCCTLKLVVYYEISDILNLYTRFCTKTVGDARAHDWNIFKFTICNISCIDSIQGVFSEMTQYIYLIYTKNFYYRNSYYLFLVLSQYGLYYISQIE